MEMRSSSDCECFDGRFGSVEGFVELRLDFHFLSVVLKSIFVCLCRLRR